MLTALSRALFYVASRGTFVGLCSCAVLICVQDALIFPSAELWLFSVRASRDRASLPEGIESFMIPNEAGRFEVWRMKAQSEPFHPKRIALIAKGNGGFIASMLGFHRWFREQGITSYSIEYRGYGLSNGWPSESGILADMKRLWSFALAEEKVTNHDVILFGQSLGTGPSTYLASMFHPRALILLSPYTSIDDVVRDRGFLRVLAPFVWNRFPSKYYLPRLKETCVIAAHGALDGEIEVHHTQDLEKLYQGSGGFKAFLDSAAGHNDIFDRSKIMIEEELQRCLNK